MFGCFNTQPPEGGWTFFHTYMRPLIVSTHSRLKAAGWILESTFAHLEVSTHSRLKAAGERISVDVVQQDGFNTQPPEGGWLSIFTDTFISR